MAPVTDSTYSTLCGYRWDGAICVSNVRSLTERTPFPFSSSSRTVGDSGEVGWSWHMESKIIGGAATVTWSLQGRSRSAEVNFSVS